MKKILILFAHPAFQRSRIHQVLLRGLEKMEFVTFRDLYQHYPELDIDVEQEQELLLQNDIIVLQHPFFWYSTPSILKEWQDLVLTHGWAYGKGGNALKGKKCFNAISTGGPGKAYQKGGFTDRTVRELIAPIELTVRLCQMQFLPPFVVHGSHTMELEILEKHRADYHRLLLELAREELDLSLFANEPYLRPSLAGDK